MAAAVLAMGGLSTVAADDSSKFEGSGIYRPLDFLRRVKLTTAYFNVLDPSLPDKVDLAYAYPLSKVVSDDSTAKEVADALERGEMRLAVPIYESSEYLTPIKGPWRKQGDSRQPPEVPGCVDWLNAVREHPDSLKKFHVLVDKERNEPGGGRMVTWDASEEVKVWSDPPLPPETPRHH